MRAAYFIFQAGSLLLNPRRENRASRSPHAITCQSLQRRRNLYLYKTHLKSKSRLVIRNVIGTEKKSFTVSFLPSLFNPRFIITQIDARQKITA